MQKVVLLTGAAGGIGTGLVKVLSDAGWVVLGSDHPKAKPRQQFCGRQKLGRIKHANQPGGKSKSCEKTRQRQQNADLYLFVYEAVYFVVILRNRS